MSSSNSQSSNWPGRRPKGDAVRYESRIGPGRDKACLTSARRTLRMKRLSTRVVIAHTKLEPEKSQQTGNSCVESTNKIASITNEALWNAARDAFKARSIVRETKNIIPS